MCPTNPIGTVDLYLVTHHGTDSSGPAALVHGLQPRVAVMQNGTRKGAGTQAMPTMRSSPGLEDIWQLHWSYGAGHRAEQRRRVHRERRGRRDDRGRADGAAAGWRRTRRGGRAPAERRAPPARSAAAPPAAAPPAVAPSRGRRRPTAAPPPTTLPPIAMPAAAARVGDAARSCRRTRPRTGSRSPRSRTARSRCRTAATVTARPTRRAHARR